jgi:hypothetical protein
MVDENESSQSLDLTSLEIDQLLSIFIGILVAKAWQYMGLRLIPGKDEAKKDLLKASTSIDCVSFMVDNLVSFLSEAEIDKLRSMVADLQINYARQA